ncbi:AAA family ATPase, partial [Neoaquamicrobium microcysteis]|uniref:AAA family ATPase n=1 Tax=Neoaquamicrobium microcysteis TaxID=2682781 RepID=UPI002E264D07
LRDDLFGLVLLLGHSNVLSIGQIAYFREDHFSGGRPGVPVVFDFGGNTAKDRAWVREVFEAANAAHLLHVIPASDERCLSNIHRRNVEKPPGLYWGSVSDEMFHAMTRYFTTPQPSEGFHIRTHPLTKP